MIGKLTGKIDSIADDHLLLDVAGVGYYVFCSGRTLGLMPQAGGHTSLLIDTHVREDHIHLYGFANAAEQQWFRTLTTVQGVGVKMAMAILSALAPEQILTAIAAQDKKVLTIVSGVGPKLAERIVTELKSQAVKLGAAGFSVATPHAGNAADGAAAKSAKKSPEQSAAADALSALVHLGYGRSEAFSAVMRLQQNQPDIKIDALIRDALRELAA
ncbi:MAG: Holliday junction branch migration protein RuvA [Rhodospirillales bacterium 12-54-5]|nr:MAG: Holliday junction branch migration protein RuvA [Rhodospirillales bacterium 12-54-5]